MKKGLKVIASILATIGCFGAFAACGGNGDGGSSSGGSSSGGGAPAPMTITVGYTDYAPMNYEDENGTLVGFDTELAQKAFGELGYQVRFKVIAWNNKYAELDGGTIDCIWNGFTANCADDDGVERSDKVDFSYYYMQNAQCVIRKTSTTALNTIEDLKGNQYTVAYEEGSAGDSYFAEATKGWAATDVRGKGVTSQMDAVKEVNAGTAQFAIVDILLAQSLAGQGDYANLVIESNIEIPVEYYAVGFKKGSDLTAKINAKFKEYAESGYLMELAEKYGLETKLLVDFDE